MKLEFPPRSFEKYSNIKFHENLSSGSRVVSMWTDGWTDMTKLIVAFRNFANAPKAVCLFRSQCVLRNISLIFSIPSHFLPRFMHFSFMNFHLFFVLYIAIFSAVYIIDPKNSQILSLAVNMPLKLQLLAFFHELYL
jgi:hypothetical protein